MHKTVVLNVVGLTPRLLPQLPSLAAFKHPATIAPAIPAVTCTAQSTYLTGHWPSEHGIVANGWYYRDDCEIHFWKQSDKLVQRPRLWDLARQRDPAFTCANLFWWYAMYSSCDYTVTPRPMYPADGRKLPDIWTAHARLRRRLQDALGQFPLFKFWGPATSIDATQWIADAAIEIDLEFHPTLNLIYLPHLDYVLQRGGDPADDVRQLDAVLAQLLAHFQDARILILSEYGITPVSRPIHINRILRQAKLITIREELGRELLDAGASPAFAVADHQIAHVYINDRSRLVEVKELLTPTPGIARVLDEAGKRELHLDHPRSGELVCLADPDAWFTYYYWLDDARAPDFARTVDIHRKPGYDPAELFLASSKARIAWILAKRKLGLRALMDVIPLDATLVKGSHGLAPRDSLDAPLLLTNTPALLDRDLYPAPQIRDLILNHLFP